MHYACSNNIMQDVPQQNSAPQNRHSLVKYKMGQSVRKFIPLPVVKRSKWHDRTTYRTTNNQIRMHGNCYQLPVVKLGGTLSVRLCAYIIPSVRLVVKYHTRFKVVKLI